MWDTKKSGNLLIRDYTIAVNTTTFWVPCQMLETEMDKAEEGSVYVEEQTSHHIRQVQTDMLGDLGWEAREACLRYPAHASEL
jgi:hypothetical protein